MVSESFEVKIILNKAYSRKFYFLVNFLIMKFINQIVLINSKILLTSTTRVQRSSKPRREKTSIDRASQASEDRGMNRLFVCMFVRRLQWLLQTL